MLRARRPASLRMLWVAKGTLVPAGFAVARWLSTHAATTATCGPLPPVVTALAMTMEGQRRLMTTNVQSRKSQPSAERGDEGHSATAAAPAAAHAAHGGVVDPIAALRARLDACISVAAAESSVLAWANVTADDVKGWPLDVALAFRRLVNTFELKAYKGSGLSELDWRDAQQQAAVVQAHLEVGRATETVALSKRLRSFAGHLFCYSAHDHDVEKMIQRLQFDKLEVDVERFDDVGNKRMAGGIQALLDGDSEVTPIVAGESGSGKTHFLLTRKLMRGAVPTFTVLFGSGPVASDFTNKFASLVKAHDEAAANAFVELVTAAVMRATGFADRGPREDIAYNVIVAFDEMGSHPEQLRLICRYSSRIRKAVKQRLRVQTVRVMAAGTGVDFASAAPGSNPDTFALFSIQPEKCVWNERVAAIVAAHPERESEVAALTRLPSIGDLLGNPRAARALAFFVARELVERRENLVFSAPYLLRKTAEKYSSLNGLSTLPDERSLLRNSAMALRMALCPSASVNMPASAAEYVIPLVSKLGLLVDNARRVTREMWNSLPPESKAALHAYRESNGDLTTRDPAVDGDAARSDTVLCFPKAGRFKMSAAMALMVSSLCGARLSVGDPSGSELEEAVATKIGLALQASTTVGELFEALGFNATDSDTAAVLSGLDLTRTLDGRCILQTPLEHRVSRGNKSKTSPTPAMIPRSAEAELVNIKRRLQDPNVKAVVAMNAKGAPHADLIVAAKGLLLFFQTKFVLDGYADVSDEMEKMHLPSSTPSDVTVTTRLEAITEARACAVFAMCEPIDEVTKAAGDAGALLGTKASGFMYPLSWPARVEVGEKRVTWPCASVKEMMPWHGK